MQIKQTGSRTYSADDTMKNGESVILPLLLVAAIFLSTIKAVMKYLRILGITDFVPSM